MATIYKQGKATVTIPAGETLAVYTAGTARVNLVQGYPNVPGTETFLAEVTAGQTVFTTTQLGTGTYAGTVTIEAQEGNVDYAVGVGPVTKTALSTRLQGAPGVLNATGTLTVAMIAAGIVTSTTAAAVAGTLDTGAVVDAALDLAVGDSFVWSLINTGGNTFTVTASTGHTIVGVATVVTVTSAQFRTRKTAADTYVTYRLA